MQKTEIQLRESSLKTKLILLLGLSLSAFWTAGQEERKILQIKADFQAWQPLIEVVSGTELFHYTWGENYEKDQWYSSVQNADGKVLYQKAFIIENPELGTFVHYDNYAISGDWYISVDYYFDANESLYFVFWKMNTFQAEEPVTVEKRRYFNAKGEEIKSLTSTYKMNTREESSVGYADRDLDYEVELSKMSFYPKWKEE